MSSADNVEPSRNVTIGGSVKWGAKEKSYIPGASTENNFQFTRNNDTDNVVDDSTPTGYKV